MITIFIDESGADGNTRHLVHGALFVRDVAISPMREAIMRCLGQHALPDELKWTSTSLRRQERDLAAVRCFFNAYGTATASSSPRFQCLIADQHKLNIRNFHNGDADMCFYKLLYPLLVKRISQFACASEDVHVVLDERSTSGYDLESLKDVLGHGVRKSRPRNSPNIRTVEYRDSKDEPLIQMADFLTGAVCYQQNGRHLKSDASSAKKIASAEIAAMIGADDLTAKNRYDDRFGIWTLRLRDGRAA